MIIRLATCEDTDIEVSEVIEALKEKDYIYWGNDRAETCDYLFIHSQGSSTVLGVLKVRSIQERGNISKENFLSHRPKGWGSELVYKRYFLVEDARKENIVKTTLADGKGQQLKAMHDMNFVTSNEFKPF